MGSFGGGLETIAIEFDPKSILAGIQRVNQDLEGLEGKSQGSTAKLQKDWQSVADVLTRVSDRSKNSADSYIRSLERQAAAIGKSGLDKLNAQMEQAIKNYGYSESAIKKITAAYEKMAEAQERGGQGFGAGTRAGIGARDLFEGRNAYAAVEFTKGLSELKGAPAIIGGITAAFGAAAAAGYELVKSSAEEARELNNLAIRTGLSVEETENLSIQAKIAGVDINSLERSAVQLSRGLEDAAGAGKQQAQILHQMGISTLEASGHQKEMGEVLSEVLQKLSQIPDTSKRLYEAQLLLGRGAKELQPMIVDLATLKETADQLTQSLASGANEELLKAARQISTMDEAWSIFKKNLAAKIAPIVIPVVTYFSNHLSGNPQNDQANANWVNQMTPHGLATAGREIGIPGLSYAPSASATSGLVGTIQSSVQSSVSAEDTRQRLLKGIGTTPEALETQIADKKKQIEQDISTLNQKGAQDATVYTNAQKDLNKALGEQLALENELKAVQAAKNNTLDRYLTELKAATSSQNVSPLQKILEERDAKLREFQDQFNYLPKAQLDSGAQQITEAFSQAFNRALGDLQVKSNRESQKVAEDTAKQQVTMAEERLAIEKSITDQVTKQAVEGSKSGFFPTPPGGPLIPLPQTPGLGTPPGPSSRQEAEITKDMLAQESRRIELVAGPGGELAAARQIISLKQQSLAIDEQQAELEAQGITNQFDREKKIYDIRLQYAQQVYDAESQYQDKLLEKQKQLAELTAGLYHTLLTNPSKFPKQLANTVNEASLRPLTEGLGNVTAGLLSPLIYGRNGGGGIAGIFGRTGGLTDVQSTNGAMHVFVTNPGTPGTSTPFFGTSGSPGFAVPSFNRGTASFGGFAPSFGGGFIPSFGGSSGRPSVITIPFGTGGGVPIPVFGGGYNGGSSDSSTVSLPYFGASAPLFSGGTADTSGFSGTGYQGFGGYPSTGGGVGLGFASAALRAFGGSTRGVGFGAGNPASIIGPGGTSGFAGPVGGTSGGYGIGALSGLKGGWSNIGASFGIGQGAPSSDSTYSDPDTWVMGPNGPQPPSGSGSTTFGSVAGSPAVGSLVGGAGLKLAENGLLGNDRGTWSGTFQGAAGGAMLGFEYGGPIGAAVGATVGFAIGVGEQLAGVVSPQNRVIQLVQSEYHIRISAKVADSIVALAKQKYANQLATAVHSPEVRQMLGLYAAGTGQGQASILSSTVPHGGSLVEQGGALYQQATYQYGQAYTYQSNLPVLGGPVAGNYPNPSGSPAVQNVMISLNGQAAADALEGRVATVVTPSYLADGFAQANASSNGRVQASADLSQPGLITG